MNAPSTFQLATLAFPYDVELYHFRLMRSAMDLETGQPGEGKGAIGFLLHHAIYSTIYIVP